MAAAAAVVVTRAARARQNGLGFDARSPGLSLPGGLPRTSATRPFGSGLILTVCLSVGLTSVGIWMLAHSFHNQREKVVADYDATVERWSSQDRSRFETSEFIASATGSGKDGTVTGSMMPENSLDWTFVDSEGGAGIEDYEPLKYVATFQFPSYTTWVNSSVVLLPNRSAAAKVRFRLRTKAENGSASTLETADFPIAFDEVVHAKTPAPQQKCRTTQHGVWHEMRCHVVKRLSKVCLQISQDTTGKWQFNPRDGKGSYGCDPARDWEPALYVLDPCWGSKIAYGCTPVGSFQVSLTVRSASDPFLRAEELTGDRFDFGHSEASQQTIAGVFLAAGVVSALPPLLSCLLERRARRAEDREALSPSASRFGRKSAVDA